MEEIAFDDVAAIQKHVSEEFGAWGDEIEVTQEMINDFAELTGDHQWIHIDLERCKTESPFKTTIAHGFLTLSMIPALAPSFDVPGVRMGINYGLDRVRFITPVPSGSRIRARSVLQAGDEVPGGVQAKAEITIELEGADKPACVAETLSRLYF